MADHPIEVCLKTADNLVKEGHTVYQKFTCDKCGSRQTIDVPNKFYETGKCEECNHITDIVKKGCNYLAVLTMKRSTRGNV